MSDFTHILAQISEKLSFLVQLELFWLSVIFMGVQKKLGPLTFQHSTWVKVLKSLIGRCLYMIGESHKYR